MPYQYNDPYYADCSKHQAWIEIVLVDELNKPIVNMPYTLEVSRGATRTGRTDHNGIAREENLPPTVGRFSIDAQSLVDEMETRPLRVRRDGRSKPHHEAIQRKDNYRYVTVGDLCDSKPNILNWNEPELPKHHFKTQNPNGYRVMFRNERWVFEVCPFWAWSFMLHHQKDYSITNACNLSILSVLSYASLTSNNDKEPDSGNYIGSIEDVFLNQFFDLSKIPTQFEMNSFTPVVYDVPFKDRYTEIEFIDSGKNLDTQLFYIANSQEMIVVWRGTASMNDVFTDMRFKPVKLQDDMGVQGYVHSGFYNSFKTMDNSYLLRKDMNSDSSDVDGGNILAFIDNLASNRKLFIAGHSLGGALALLHAVQLKNYNPVLYTVGMPRVLTISVAEQLKDIIHHRHVNENDAVPALPFEKDMNNFAFKEDSDWLGYSIEIALTYADWKTEGLSSKAIDYQKKRLSAKNDKFVHHGDAVHFYKKTFSRYSYGGHGNIIPIKTEEKLYLVSELLEDHRLKQEFFELYRLPKKASPDLLGALDHSSVNYANFIIYRLINLLKDEVLTDSAYEIRAELIKQKGISKSEYDESSYLLDLDLMVADTLLPTLLQSEGAHSLERFKYANNIY